MSAPHIAIVDDDLAVLDVTELLLALEGYHPVGFATVAEAIRRVAELQPALIIVDLHVEDRDAGLVLIAAVRRDSTTTHIPILLWSGDPDVEVTVAQSKARRVIVRRKPLHPTELLSLVADLSVATP